MSSQEGKRARPVWWGCGIALLLCTLGLAALSHQFEYGSDMRARPVLPFVGLLMGAALVYFGGVYMALQTAPTQRLAYGIFAVGALMRLILATSQPVLEDDYYRYLWDGAVTAHGENPYGVIPLDVQERDAKVSGRLLALGNEAGTILERVNHPQLGTVYPPVAQAAFALAHAVSPWKLSGLRLLYYALDCAVFALLVAVLRQLGRSPLLALIYWWNPLAAKEIYNSVHMDILLVPLTLGAILLALRGRVIWAMVPLALAVGTKLWPVLLLVPLLVTARHTPRKAGMALVVFLLGSVLLLSPLLTITALEDESGFVAYGSRWEMNDALFMVFPWIAEGAAHLLQLDVSHGTAHRAGKGLVALLTLGVVAWVTRKTYRSYGSVREHAAYSLCGGLLAIVGTLFLLSPTQFPWYFLWLLPLLSLYPNRGLLLLTLVLPLYYLRFYFDARGAVEFFHYRIVWLEYLPVWALLLFDALQSQGKQRGERAMLESDNTP